MAGSGPIGHWNHRVLRSEMTALLPGQEPEIMYAIHEVYYHDDGTPKAHTTTPIPLRGDSYRELAEDWIRIKAAFDKPVLEYVDGTYREIEVKVAP